MKVDRSSLEWAETEFGEAELGDSRRGRRLIRMAATMALRPAGRICQVFTTSAERQGAYDLVANHALSPTKVLASAARATCNRAQEGEVIVAVDGTSLTLVDRGKKKGFGPIGALQKKARGLKVISAYAISADGTPLGLLSQTWWNRSEGPKRQRYSRPLGDKETRHWLDTMTEATARVAEVGRDLRLCFVADRECDSRHVLETLDGFAASGHTFIVRSSANRRVFQGEKTRKDGRGRADRIYVKDRLAKTRSYGTYRLQVPAGPGRTARIACMSVRAVELSVRVVNRQNDVVRALRLNFVETREIRTCPRGETPIHWRLLTNIPAVDSDAARQIVDRYSLRWRIEEFHRTWKSGRCNIETTQLRQRSHVIRWATLMAPVATRIERLKALSRTQPDRPATTAFSQDELEALRMEKEQTKRRNEVLPRGTPTLAQAVLWVAEMGGYTGKSSGGPPGSITIGRGLERLSIAANVLKQLRSAGKIR